MIKLGRKIGFALIYNRNRGKEAVREAGKTAETVPRN